MSPCIVSAVICLERCSAVRISSQAAPGSDEDASSKLWLYRSVLTQQTDANSGLVGPIIVTAPDAAAADGSPSDVDVEFVTLFQVPTCTDGHAGCQQRAREIKLAHNRMPVSVGGRNK